jgi:hypothetical protein
MALPDKDRRALAAGQNLHAGPNFVDLRGANKDHLKRSAGECGFCRKDGGIDLTAVCIALNGCIQQAQGTLRGINDLAGKQNGSGAGAEGGLFLAKLLQGLKEAVLLEEAEDGGGFAAGQYQAVQAGKLIGLADLDWLRAGFGEGLGVGGVVALDGKDADFGILGFSQRFL